MAPLHIFQRRQEIAADPAHFNLTQQGLDGNGAQTSIV